MKPKRISYCKSMISKNNFNCCKLEDFNLVEIKINFKNVFVVKPKRKIQDF